MLFEQNTGQKAVRNEFEDEGNDEDLPGRLGGPIKKSKNNPKIRDKKGKKLGVVEEVAVRIEGLSYKV